MPSHGEREQLIRQLREKGVGVVRSRRNGHWKLYYQGRMIGSLSSTPGGYRWRANAIAVIRRAGIKWP